jgi:hypothetical protein
MTNQPQMKFGKQSKKQKWVIWLLIAIILLLLVSIGYMWWLLQNCNDTKAALENDKQQLQAQIDTLAQQKAEPVEEPVVVCSDTPTDALKSNIKAALNTKNTAVFTSYVSNPVLFVLAASEKGGDETPDQAAASMEYTHSATGPWDFNLPQTTLDAYDAGFYTNYFDANTYVGRAADGMVTAFDFDCNGKINQIFVAANEDLL